MSRTRFGTFGIRARLAVALRLNGWGVAETARIIGCSHNASLRALSRMRVPYHLTAKQYAEHWERWSQEKRC